MEDIRDYSEKYHTWKARSSTFFNIWVRGAFGRKHSTDELYLVGETESSPMVHITLKGKQIYDLVSEYEMLYESIKSSVKYEIQGKVKDEGVKIKGVRGSVDMVEPDIFSARAQEKNIETTGAKEIIRDIVWRRLSEPILIECSVSVSNGKLVVTTQGEYDATWKYSSPENVDRETEILIESLGGGLPEGIDNTQAYVVHRKEAPLNMVNDEETGRWCLVPPSHYEEIGATEKIKKYVRALRGN